MLLLVLLLITLISPTTTHAANLFTEDWESSVGTLQAKYACSSTPPRSPFTDGDAQDWDTAQRFAGTYAMKQTYSGSQYDPIPQGGGHCEYDFSDQTQRDIWITWYHQLGTGWQTSGGGGVGGVGTKGIYMYMKSLSTGQVNGWVFHYFYGGQQLTLSAQGIKDHKGPNGPGTGTAIPYDTENMWQNVQGFEQPDGQWVCYEANFKLNTPGAADGQYLLYSTNMTTGGNTILRASHVNREFLDSTTSGRMPSDARWFRFKYYRQDGSGSMWYDNTYVDSTRRGCSGSPPPSDTTPPGQVTGLTAVSNTTSSTLYTWTARTESDLQSYIVQGCTGAACTNFATIGTVPAGTTTFNATGRAANTLYRVRVAAQDTSNNVGTASSIVDDTTDAASVLPTVTAFTSTATGGQITYTGSPASYRIAFGGQNPDGSFWNNELIFTAANVPAGVLTFQWPSTTAYRCAHARDGSSNEDPLGYVCNGGILTPTTNTLPLRRLSGNPIWLTLDGTKAKYLTGISGGNDNNVSFSGILDIFFSSSVLNVTQRVLVTDNITRADAATLGSNWTNYTAEANTLKVTSNEIRASNTTTNAAIAYYNAVLPSSNQKVCAKLTRHVTGGAYHNMGLGVRLKGDAADLDGYEAIIETGNTVGIGEFTSGTYASLTSVAHTPTVGNIYCLQAVGNTLRLYNGSTLLLTTTDATYHEGYAGVGIYLDAGGATTDVAMDDVTINDVAFDATSGIAELVTAGANFTRLWSMEQTAWGDTADFTNNTYQRIPLNQMPWALTTTRSDTSTGRTVTVGVYDLDTFNQTYFDTLRSRILTMIAAGVTPSVMLFSGGHLQYFDYSIGNPFMVSNNINGVTCDANANGLCEESHTLSNATIVNYEKAYLRRVIDTLNDIDNFVFEVSNEDQFDSTLWHEMVLAYVAEYEATKSKQHLLWASAFNFGAAANNNYLFNLTDADIVSPACTSAGAYVDYDNDPPANDGSKTIFNDSDHAAYSCGTVVRAWPWKNFVRGHYPVYLSERESGATQTAIKAAMAQTLIYATKIDLANAYPETGTSVFSTGYGLFTGTNSTTPNCSEYILYQPSAATNSVNLSACSAGASFAVEYLDPVTGTVTTDTAVNGGASRNFTSAGERVVYLKLSSVTDVTAPVITSCTTSPANPAPAGTTSVTITCITDENATLKYDTAAGTAYGSMPSTFGTTGGVNHSTTIGSLTDGNNYARYVRASDGTNATTTDYPVVWSVSADVVSTVPDDVTNVRGTLNGTSGTILWQWDAVSGADHYVIEISQGVTFLTAIETANASTSYQQGSLTVGSYNARVKAVNGANQSSTNWAISAAPVNADHPPTLTGLYDTAPGSYTNTIVLSWDAPTASSLVAIVERGTGSSCVDADFSLLGGVSAVTYTDSTVAAATTYCYRAKFSNPTFGGISQAWSDTVYATTRAASTGALTGQRIQVPYGQPRLPRN